MADEKTGRTLREMIEAAARGEGIAPDLGAGLDVAAVLEQEHRRAQELAASAMESFAYRERPIPAMPRDRHLEALEAIADGIAELNATATEILRKIKSGACA